ncbi:hypothetical protein Sme01_63710 [Sphaerisporangium melleum]|uniref:Signal transduction histidine-protein kinase/phosphatase MprB n=1 Tax=Sphaerisporangium melleum TaxID=321316 RepID=A0A917RGG6_9ACTN|nr:DUF4153 domain-containing protein [Sphaerisporangium melleum]GGL05379.1 hypothetical protein GCM10007964_54500 [Sphaerisporangium melleum]GII73895.1 hypothetical protein Sme01_63710 [Sphaerisporangium melleum]
MRPLDFLGRIKVKLGLVILLAVATAFALNEYGRSLGVLPWARMGVAAVLSLGMVQLIGRGMTRPLREMAAAAQTIAKGRCDMRVTATSRDEVGELARAFNAMAADLAEVDRQRRELVANVSHELRTPIAGLQAVLENLVDGVSAPDPATLGTALTQTERLGRLVVQLLDLSRLDSGVRPIEPEPVELGPLCAQAVREAGLAREEVRLSSSVPAGLGVRADPALLAQVLANLLDNAVRHSPPGGLVRLDAAARGDGVRLGVIDAGPGIPAPERPRVFERFSRLDAARAADAGGTGLGLAIVREIVELHGGSVRVAETTSGCHMVVDLPGRTTIMGDVPLKGERSGAVPATGEVQAAGAARLAGDIKVAEAFRPAGDVQVAGAAWPAGDAQVDGMGKRGGGARSAGSTASGAWSVAGADAGAGTAGGTLTGTVAGPGAGVRAGEPSGAGEETGRARQDAGRSAPSGAVVPGEGRTPPGFGPPGYVPPPLLPRPDLPPTPRWLLPVAAAVGLLAAIALPDAAPGLGIVAVAVAAGAAVLPAARHRLTPWTVAFGLLAYGLVSIVLFRDAQWLAGPALLAGFGLAALAVSGAGEGWGAVVRGGLSVVLAVVPLPWFLGAPLKTSGRRRNLAAMVAALCIAVVLLLVFGVLFASADAVFASFAANLLTAPDWVEYLPGRLVLFGMFAALVAAATLVALRPRVERAGPATRRRVSRVLWTIPLAALDLLFAAFVVVQITTLFGGNRRVMETAGLTYAEYARSGFFELVTVSVFVLGLVALAIAVVAPSGRERALMAALLGVLCALTLVILASALHRLDLYIDAYGLSRLRAAVGATIWWLAAVFALVLAAGGLRLARRSAAWLPRTVVLVTGLSILAFAVWNPDLRVAESQLGVRGSLRVDVGYLLDLSADAVPAIDRMPARDCLLSGMPSVRRLAGGPDGWSGWNLARRHARDLLAARPPIAPLPACGKEIRSPGT